MIEKSAWQKYKENLGDTRPWDLLNQNIEHVDEETRASRMKLCQECPELIQLTKQCKKCGCLMHLKTRLPNATCPLGKW